jgi:hypothetical protein
MIGTQSSLPHFGGVFLFIKKVGIFMLIRFFMLIFAIIIFYIGYYLYAHRSTDFMMLKPTTNNLLSRSLNVVGKMLMIVSVLTLVLGMTGNSILILVALVLGIFSTTGTLLFLLKFL